MEKSFIAKFIGRLGGDEQDVHEHLVLNDVLSSKDDGPRLEAHPRRQEIRISELDEDVRGLSTAGVNNQLGDGDDTPPNECDVHKKNFRSTAVCANHFALD